MVVSFYWWSNTENTTNMLQAFTKAIIKKIVRLHIHSIKQTVFVAIIMKNLDALVIVYSNSNDSRAANYYHCN